MDGYCLTNEQILAFSTALFQAERSQATVEKYLRSVRAFSLFLDGRPVTKDMSRVTHCIDNGPMEGFWGILKQERYYGRRFTSKRELVQMIETYIHYYNTRRVQRKLGVLTPMEKHELGLAA